MFKGTVSPESNLQAEARTQQHRLRVVVALAWALTTTLAILYVHTFVADIPYADEWEFVPVLVGSQPWLPALWAQHNEHRMPLPRAIYYSAFSVTFSFRANSYLQIILLAGLSLWLIRTATHWRGSVAWTDLFFPLALLHPGHWENWVMGYQVCFVLYAWGSIALAVTLLTLGPQLTTGRLALIGILTLSIAACGAFGLPLACTIGGWLAFEAIRLWRRKQRRLAFWAFIPVLLLIAYVWAYFRDYQRPAGHPPLCTEPVRLTATAGQVLAMGWGPAVTPLWPWAALTAMTLTGLALRRLLTSTVPSGVRTGVFAWLVGQLALTLVIGLGRAGFGDTMGLWPRYALLSWPLLGLAYLVAVRHHLRVVCQLLCLGMALTFPENLMQGLNHGAAILAYHQDLARDAHAGWSAQELVERHFPNSFNAGQMDRGRVAIPLLREAGIGIFRQNNVPIGETPSQGRDDG
ncbi:MAG: hypothetical protein RMJ88_07655 [Thermogemmata sp.]|nr:hypothetical protein [Thermogemmata sp.]